MLLVLLLAAMMSARVSRASAYVWCARMHMQLQRKMLI